MPLPADQKPSTRLLADTAGVLSARFYQQLQRFCQVVRPQAPALETAFNKKLERRFDARQRKALAAVTAGAAAVLLCRRRPAPADLAGLWEHIEYHGRRLAKLNVSPAEIQASLHSYALLLSAFLRQRIPTEVTELRWTCDQLHFCVVLTLNNAFYQVREAETAAFYALFRAEMEAKTPEELLAGFAVTLTQVCRAAMGRVMLRRQLESFPASLLRRLGQPHYIPRGARAESLILEPRWRGKYASYWSIPLLDAGKMAGVVQFAFSTPYEWLPRELQLLDAAGERLLLAAEKARLIEVLAAREEQVRQLAEHMLQVEEEERRRISRELHDEAGQSLLFIRLQLELAEKSVPTGLPELCGQLADTRKVAERTILEVRRIIAALSPAVLEQLGLAAAVRQLTNRLRAVHPCSVRLQLGKLTCLPKDAEVILYRLVQECYQNIAKHSGANTVNLSLRSTDRRVELSVTDNGGGFEVASAVKKRNSFGLNGMMERVALLGGTFDVRSGTGKGTRISIKLPIRSKRPSVAA